MVDQPHKFETMADGTSQRRTGILRYVRRIKCQTEMTVHSELVLQERVMITEWRSGRQVSGVYEWHDVPVVDQLPDGKDPP